MRPTVNGGATRAATGGLPLRAIDVADGTAIVGYSGIMSLPALRNQTAQDDTTTNLFFAADLRL